MRTLRSQTVRCDQVVAPVGLGLTFIRVYDQLDDVDLATQARKLDVPVILAEGRHDYNAMSVLAVSYYEVLEAPHKELMWFERSDHNPEHEEALAFDPFMVETVLAKTLR